MATGSPPPQISDTCHHDSPAIHITAAPDPPSSTPLHPTAPPSSTPPPPGSLTIATYNLGGPSITKERFGHTISALCQAFPTLPKIISLCEFKPTGAPFHEFEWLVTVMTRGQYYLVASTDPLGRNGIALLIHQDLSPRGPPSFSVVLPSRILAFQAKIHSDPNIPPITFLAVYGSCLRPDRAQLQQALSPLLSGPSIIFGDLNAITRMEDASDMTLAYAQKLVWPWLRESESSGTLVDLMRVSYQDLPPKTRHRGHAGRSRLDHIFVTKYVLPLLSLPKCIQLLPPSPGSSNHLWQDRCALSFLTRVRLSISYPAARLANHYLGAGRAIPNYAPLQPRSP